MTLVPSIQKAVEPLGHSLEYVQFVQLLLNVMKLARINHQLRFYIAPIQPELHKLGFVPGSSDVYIAVMHSGVTLAPIMGQYISREILDDISIDSLAPYRPTRFAGLVGRKNFTAIRV